MSSVVLLFVAFAKPFRCFAEPIRCFAEVIRQIKEHVNGRIHDVYGIGTYLSNDVGVNPLNIVIKLFEVKPNGAKSFVPTVKLSDDRGKYTGSDKEVQLCLLTINQ